MSPNSPKSTINSSPVLYIVATPIGHMGDLSIRAANVLRAVDIVFAEDTRRTRTLLGHIGSTPSRVLRLDAHATESDIAQAVETLLKGNDAALVSDAGTPLVSDPGSALIERAIDKGVRVVPIPGPCAPVVALCASGICGNGAFRFVGFLSRNASKQAEEIATIAQTPEAVVLFEAPSRIHNTLVALSDAMPHRAACVARELTKVHEEFLRGTVAELATLDREWIGEIVLVLSPYEPATETTVTNDQLDERIRLELRANLHPKTIASKLAAWSGRQRRDVYQRIVELKGQK